MFRPRCPSPTADITTTSTANKTAVATVSHTGRDATVGFGPEQIVEITDEGRLLRSQPGVLAQIDSIEDRTLLLSHVDAVPLTMADFPVNPIVRRWDGTGAVETSTWVKLEDGVFVEFAEGPNPATAFRTGDYWTIRARTLNGQVEWPQSGGVPRFEERRARGATSCRWRSQASTPTVCGPACAIAASASRR